MTPPKYRLPTLLIMLAMGLSTAGCGKSPEEHFADSQSLFQKGDVQGAILELKSTLQAQPQNGEARLLLGTALLSIEGYESAAKEFEQARKSGIADDRILSLLAESYLRMGETQKVLDLGIPPGSLNRQDMATMQAIRAEAYLRQDKQAEADQAIALASQTAPDNPTLLMLLARLATKANDTQKALALVEQALRLNPSLVYAYYLKGDLQEKAQQDEDALETYAAALKHDPKAFRAHLAINRVNLRLGHLDVAERALKQAEQAAPGHPLVQYARGTLELRRNNLKAANESFLQVLRTAPDHLPTILASALANLGLGNYEQSLKGAQRVLGDDPHNDLAKRIVAASQLRSGNPREALAILEPMLQASAGDAKLMALAGEAHLRAQDYQQALKTFEKVEALSPNDPLTQQHVAASLIGLGETDKAIATLQQASSETKENTSADLGLISLHLQRKEFDKALQAINGLEKKRPANAATYNLRATALLGKQDKEGARKAYARALEMDPKFLPAILSLAYMDLLDRRLDPAKRGFEKALELQPANLQAHLALAQIAALKHSSADYVATLERAIKVDPNALQPRALLARHYLETNAHNRALAIAQDAVNAAPGSLQALDLLGATQLASRNAQSAIDTYRRITAKAPDSADAHLRLALAYIAANDLGNGRKTLSRAQQINPKSLPILDTLVQVELQESRPDAALRWTKAMQLASASSPLGHEREGDILMIKGQPAAAVESYRLAWVKSGRNNSSLLIKWHAAAQRGGGTGAAQAELDGWIKQHPKDYLVQEYRANEAMRQGNYKFAAEQYATLQKLRPNDANALNNLAHIYHQTKDPRALRSAEAAYKLQPENPAVLDTLGWLKAEAGDYQKGAELLEKAMAKAPGNPTIRYHYASALARAGDKTKARTILTKLLNEKTAFPERALAESLHQTLK